MKRIILYGISVLMLLCITSCEKWLDVNPKSEIKADKLFDTEAGFKDALTGLYINMTSKDVYGANLSWQAIEFMAGQYDGGKSSYIELQKYNFEHNSSKNFIQAVWAKEYNIISETNLLLESLEKKGNILNPTLYNVIKGEALAIRAMCHFDLIRLFAKGNLAERREILTEPCIPYVTEYSKEITDQQTYEATLQLLHQDLNDALSYLKSDPLYTGTEERPEDYEDVTDNIFFNGTYYKGRETRLSYPAVLLLNARVYLWEGNQEKALEYAEKLIKSYEQYVAQGDMQWATESSYVSSEGDNRDYVFQGELLFALDVQKLNEYIDLILLDIQLPDGNGISLCKEIKEKYEMPIIFLSCLNDEETIVRGLNEGGDDYVCKPFGIKELCARIECNLRKVTKQQGVYYIDDLIIDTLKHKVFKDNKELELSTITFALLMALVEGHGRVLTRDYLLMLIEDITGHVVEDNTLTAHLKRLRQTLGEYQNRKYIETLRGVGYRWKI